MTSDGFSSNSNLHLPHSCPEETSKPSRPPIFIKRQALVIWVFSFTCWTFMSNELQNISLEDQLYTSQGPRRYNHRLVEYHLLGPQCLCLCGTMLLQCPLTTVFSGPHVFQPKEDTSNLSTWTFSVIAYMGSRCSFPCFYPSHRDFSTKQIFFLMKISVSWTNQFCSGCGWCRVPYEVFR